MKSANSQFSLFIIVLTLCGFVTSAGLLWQTPNTDEQYFPQTGKRIANEFYGYWKEHGGRPVFGYPISDLDYLKDPETGRSITTQWFERNRFDLYPQPSGGVEVRLGPLGKELRQEALAVDPDYLPAAKLFDPALPTDAQAYFEQTKHNLHFRFLEYWRENGGAERFGYPISEEHLEFEPETNNYYVTQWFEKARFEYHPENKAPDDVLLGLLGNQLLTRPNSFDFLWKQGRRASFLSQPRSIFVDANKNIYVADRGNGRINKYGPDLKLISFWYMEGGTQAIAGIRGDKAPADSPLLYEIAPSRRDVRILAKDGTWKTLALENAGDADANAENLSLTVDGSGNIYLLKQARLANTLVWKYDAQGKFKGKYVQRKDVQNPTDLAVSGSNIYISDGTTGSYKVFDDKNNLTKTVDASPAKDATQKPALLSIAADEKGYIYVGEYGRITKFDQNGVVVPDFGAQFGSAGRGLGQLWNPLGIFVHSDGQVYVADPANHRLNLYDDTGNYQSKIIDEEVNLPGRLASARGLALMPGANPTLYVADPVNERIQSFNLVGSLQPQKWTARKINQLAVSPQGELYALNTAEGLVTVFDTTGKQVAQLDGNDGGTRFNMPRGLTLDKDGNLFVADTGNKIIQKFDKNHKFVQKFGDNVGNVGKFGGTGIFTGPTSIAVEPNTGNIYVVDEALFRVLKFDPKGNFLKVIAKPDTENNRPFRPVLVAAPPYRSGTTGDLKAADGIYIAAREGIYKLNSEDKAGANIYANSLIEDGDSGDGNITNLNALAVDGDGNLYATDNFSRVQKFRLK